MLVLSRRIDDAVVIGGNITIKVLDIRGNRVRLGVVAPPEVPVHRSEIAEQCREEADEARSLEFGVRN